MRRTFDCPKMTSSFFGKDYASIYDIFMHQIPYDSWADYTEDMLSHYGIKAKSILDLACGTGSLSIILDRRGFHVTAIDYSKHMLRKLREKLQKAGHNISINIINARLSDFTIPRAYDCAICYFDSINYIICPEELSKTFRVISRNLRVGSLFIFDINTTTAYKNGVFNRQGIIKHNASVIRYHYSGDFDEKALIAKMQLKFSIKESPSDLKERSFQETHLQRAYKYDNIKDSLRGAFFKVVGFFKAFSFSPARITDERWTFVAKKIEGGYYGSDKSTYPSEISAEKERREI